MAFKIDPVWIVVALLVYALFFRRKSGYGSNSAPMSGVRMKGIDYDGYYSTGGMQERSGPQASVNFAPGSFGEDDE